MYIVYSLLLGLLVVLSAPWWLVQMLRLGKYRAGLRERLGSVPARLNRNSAEPAVWIHAVSVGEVLATSRLVSEFRALYPARNVFVSTTTATGQQLARERFGEDAVFYMPLDFGFALKAYLAALKPSLLVLAETEFWPNLLHHAAERGIKVAVVNARISDRSFPRYRRFRWFFSPVLRPVSLFLAQTKLDAERLCAIGAPAQRVHVSGNLKFDVRQATESPLVRDLRTVIPAGTSVIVCGSTTEGEEELVLAAFEQVQRQFPAAILILAPRHPERFNKVADLISARGLKFLRRSNWTSSAPVPSSVFLLDTVGELASVYSLADIAFVGGSLVPLGGHNILEPAQFGVPVLTGPHTFNFREIVNIFTSGGGLTVVNAEQLGPELIRLLHDSAARKQLGAAAKRLFLENTGATEKILAALRVLLESGGS
ncbi:MAG TPA: 3-deoxy-D-manno-octulosonic acid transferase [Candidatus Angelobacter sp.]|jgi:3-deoxy-D-manno-octulosonic-acid transferase|nr:3-deoxy-D-manno-octulosonic acid transferase [Candidatus Angelobacter sp.]